MFAQIHFNRRNKTNNLTANGMLASCTLLAICCWGLFSTTASANMLIYEGEADFEMQTNTLILDANNTGGDITLQFGASLSEALSWNDADQMFVFSNDLSLAGNQLVNFRVENLASAPSCNAASAGRQYFNTSNNLTFICNGSAWQQLENDSTNSIVITQANHGFTLTNNIPLPAYVDSSGVTHLAQANNQDTLTAFYITEIINSNSFRIQLAGIVTATGHGLSIGEYYFLSDVAASGIVTTSPSISDVTFYVLDANTLILKDNRPFNI